MLRGITRLPKYILHKGYAKRYAENTIGSLRDARMHSAQWVEFDVNILGDGTPVVFHDGEINGRKLLHYRSYFDLCAEDFYSKGYSYKPPTLSKAIEICSELNLGINLDLKESAYGNERAIIEVINKYSQPLLISSFNQGILDNCSNINKNLLIGILFDRIPYNWREIAKGIKADSIHVNHEHLNDLTIKGIKQEGYPLIAYTVNEKGRSDSLLSKGVDSVITDEIF
jgi:glycerophosphoryl diester phosphodiesterase